MRQLDFEKLDVWKRNCRLCCEVYNKELNDCKNFGFKDQLTRSALSIASNIAKAKSGKAPMSLLGFFTLRKVLPEKQSPNFILA